MLEKLFYNTLIKTFFQYSLIKPILKGESLKIRFKLKKKLIYYINKDKRNYLYILEIIKDKVFYITYNLINYRDFYYIYNYLLNLVYIK